MESGRTKQVSGMVLTVDRACHKAWGSNVCEPALKFTARHLHSDEREKGSCYFILWIF